eukprot:362897-Chlamydomonas_euryale.AAC.3
MELVQRVPRGRRGAAVSHGQTRVKSRHLVRRTRHPGTAETLQHSKIVAAATAAAACIGAGVAAAAIAVVAAVALVALAVGGVSTRRGG